MIKFINYDLICSLARNDGYIRSSSLDEITGCIFILNKNGNPLKEQKINICLDKHNLDLLKECSKTRKSNGISFSFSFTAEYNGILTGLFFEYKNCYIDCFLEIKQVIEKGQKYKITCYEQVIIVKM